MNELVLPFQLVVEPRLVVRDESPAPVTPAPSPPEEPAPGEPDKEYPFWTYFIENPRP